MTGDQAAGLRQWAARAAPASLDCPPHVAAMLQALAEQGGAGESPPRHLLERLRELAVAESASHPPAPRRGAHLEAPAAARGRAAPTLMVLGLPDGSPRQAGRVGDLLAHWAGLGRRWVGDPAAWRVVPVAVGSAHLPLLAARQPRWALWVGKDGEAFRRAWRLLLALAERPGPRRLLVVHPPGMPRRGLLDNLQQAARAFLGIQLVVLA